jgi:hypothetical protein
MPPTHRFLSECNPENLLRWGRSHGPHTTRLLECLLAQSEHLQQALRRGRGILQLGREYGSERLEAACSRALQTQALSYASVKAILVHGLDRAPNPITPPAAPPIHHHNVRGAAYYEPSAKERQA